MAQGLQRWLPGALAAAGLVTTGIVWNAGSSAPVTTGSVAAPALAPTPAPPAAPPAPMPSARSVPEAVLAAADNQPVSAHVARLLATHDPQDAYTAYLLVSSCAMFNGHRDLGVVDGKQGVTRALNPDERQSLTRMCSSMTERERLARLDYLATAVKAGVASAAWMFAAEGPFGDPSALTTRPDDPLVREWKALAATQLNAAAGAGDVTALMLWGLQNLAGSDLTDKHPVLGYGYLLAVGLIEAERTGPNHPSARTFAEGSELLNAMAGHLTPAQRAAGMAEARRIAAQVKARRARDANRSAALPAPI